MLLIFVTFLIIVLSPLLFIFLLPLAHNLKFFISLFVFSGIVFNLDNIIDYFSNKIKKKLHLNTLFELTLDNNFIIQKEKIKKIDKKIRNKFSPKEIKKSTDIHNIISKIKEDKNTKNVELLEIVQEVLNEAKFDEVKNIENSKLKEFLENFTIDEQFIITEKINEILRVTVDKEIELNKTLKDINKLSKNNKITSVIYNKNG